MSRFLWSAAALAAVAALSVSPGAVAAGSGSPMGATHHHFTRIDLRSVGAAERYVRSRGLDPSTFVIQRGARNYAGPRCPGRRWNCTKAMRVIQIGTTNDFECSPTEAQQTGTMAPDTCILFQSSPEGNTARCVEHSDAPDADQVCDITQMSAYGDNNAYVDQSIHNQMPGSSQDGRQRIRITQSSDSGQNTANWSQVIHFMTADQSGPVTQTQDGHQYSIILQRSNTGDETSNGTQFEHFTADAHDGTIEQDENTSPSPFPTAEQDCHPDTSTPEAAAIIEPNTCAFVTQEGPTSGSKTAGTVRSDIDQMNHLQVNAHSDGTITQTQGTFDGGLDLGVDQHSTAVATNQNSQHEHFQANGATPANLRQFQHGPVGANGSPDPDQTDNPNDSANFDQKSKLEASGTSQPTLDSLLTDDLTLLADDENALLNALAAPLSVIPLQEEGNILEQDSSGGLHYSTTGNATGSTDFSTNTGHAQATQSGPDITIVSECGGDPPNSGSCFSGPPLE